MLATAPSVLHSDSHSDSRPLDPIASLGDVELLSFVLSPDPCGVQQLSLSARSLTATGGLGGLGRAGPARLAESMHLHPVDAWRLAACIELGRRVAQRAAEPRERLATPQAVAGFLAPRIGSLDHEQLWVLSLDGGNRLRGVRQVARGGAHALIVTAREVLHAALADAASGFILAHNHPSGDPTPSEQDIDMTLTLAEAADIVGVPLVDHVVVTASGEFASLLDLGLLSAYAPELPASGRPAPGAPPRPSG